jgi:hypothetical protein
MEKCCKEKDLEVCAVRLHFPAHEICVIAIYRAPSGNFQYFIQNLDELLNMIFVHTADICGDINIIYLNDSSHKQQLRLITSLSWTV